MIIMISADYYNGFMSCYKSTRTFLEELAKYINPDKSRDNNMKKALSSIDRFIDVLIQNEIAIYEELKLNSQNCIKLIGTPNDISIQKHSY